MYVHICIYVRWNFVFVRRTHLPLAQIFINAARISRISYIFPSQKKGNKTERSNTMFLDILFIFFLTIRHGMIPFYAKLNSLFHFWFIEFEGIICFGIFSLYRLISISIRID